MFGSSKRCTSVLHIKTGDMWDKLNCSLQEDHAQVHRTYSEKNDWVTRWSTQESIVSGIEYQKETCEINHRSEPFVGWRCWKLSHQTRYSLHSTASAKIWDGPVMGLRESGLKVSQINLKPVDGEDYGIYSYKNPMELVSHFNLPASTYPVIGRLDLTGHVIEHEIGWRAAKAIIRELWVVRQYCGQPPNYRVQMVDEIQRQFELRYQCPVNIINLHQVKHWAEFYTNQEKAS